MLQIFFVCLLSIVVQDKLKLVFNVAPVDRIVLIVKMMVILNKQMNVSPVMTQFVLLVILMVLIVKKLVKLVVLYVLLLMSVLPVKMGIINLIMFGIVLDVTIQHVLLVKPLLLPV